MSTPFTQNHTEELPFNDLAPEQFLNLAVQTSKSLGWVFSNVNHYGFTAYTANGTFNWNAEVKLTVNGKSAKILSQSRNIRAVEFGRDKLNIDEFIKTFNSLKNNLKPLEISNQYQSLQASA